MKPFNEPLEVLQKIPIHACESEPIGGSDNELALVEELIRARAKKAAPKKTLPTVYAPQGVTYF